MNLEKDLKIAIFAHDAGGSDLLLELLRASLHVGEFKVFCTSDSPCKILIQNKRLKTYEEHIYPTRELIFFKLNLFKPDIILYSTGWQNHFEYHFLAYAKKHNLPTVAFLDNWTNYKERFGYPKKGWRKNLPDFIAVHDEASRTLANSLDLKNIVSIKNYVLAKQLKEYKDKSIKKCDTLLFLSEPTSKVAKKTYADADYWGFNEEKVFRTILENQKRLACKKLVVRLHPSDEPDIYKNIKPDVTISNNSLVEDMSCAKVVIGLDTSALNLAFLLGKKAISYIPSNKRDFHVPLPTSNRLRSFNNFDFNSIQTNSSNPNSLGIEFALFVKNILG